MNENHLDLLTWNIDFWRKIDNPNKNDVENYKEFVRNLFKVDFDFILLQEINPYFVCDKQYPKNNDNPFYYFEFENKNIYYHELSDVLLNEFPIEPF
jgi:hypothetical protein